MLPQGSDPNQQNKSWDETQKREQKKLCIISREENLQKPKGRNHSMHFPNSWVRPQWFQAFVSYCRHINTGMTCLATS